MLNFPVVALVKTSVSITAWMAGQKISKAIISTGGAMSK